MSTEMDNPLMAALQQFEATEANLVKLERLWQEIEKLIPKGIQFGSDPDYEGRCRAFRDVLSSLPMIDGWKPEYCLLSLNDIAQSRFDAQDLCEIEMIMEVENSIEAPGIDLREYRFKFNKKRLALIQDILSELIDLVDSDIRNIKRNLSSDIEMGTSMEGLFWEALRDHLNQIDTLLGSSVKRPQRWNDLRQHLHFGLVGDFQDIEQSDWPNVKAGLRKSLYDVNDPITVQVKDLSDLVASRPRGPVATKLNWDGLTPDNFERLIFSLISAESGYENPEWLMQTNAPDRGRDLSVTRVVVDPLAGTIRNRVIIQCKHWLSRSVTMPDVTTLIGQMKLWEPPRVDIHVIATSGRFTSDAVAFIEKHNQSDSALRIEMWPESHLERLLAARPSLIAEFRLR
ncbi:MAG: restriction endonuclease [Methanotrichaceae archaeon]|jgi:hypothetical protein